MALKDNFKDALDDIVGMFDNPKAQGLITALSSAAKPPQGGRVAENLSVPFGATFEQGAALRGEAQQQDAQGDARAAAERQAQIEAQRVALEGRRVSTEERATQHAMDKNVLSDEQQIRMESDNRVNELSMKGAMDQAAQAQATADAQTLENLKADNELINAGAIMDAEQDSPLGRAKVMESNANISATNAQADYYRAMAVDKLAESELATATRNSTARLAMDGKGIPTAETILDFNTAYMNIQQAVVEDLGASSEADEIIRRKGVTLFKQGYSIGAVPVEAFENVLSKADMLEMYRLDAIWQDAKRGINVAKYEAEKNRIYSDLLDNGKIDKSNVLAVDPFGMNGTGPLRPPVQGSAAPQRQPATPVPGSSLELPPQEAANRAAQAKIAELDAARTATAAAMPPLGSGKAEIRAREIRDEEATTARSLAASFRP